MPKEIREPTGQQFEFDIFTGIGLEPKKGLTSKYGEDSIHQSCWPATHPDPKEGIGPLPPQPLTLFPLEILGPSRTQKQKKNLQTIIFIFSVIGVAYLASAANFEVLSNPIQSCHVTVAIAYVSLTW
ncbi:hypothetical protein COLO4_20614 [Corchorus olitorius]|uniref:Uncharacterized protein n=1 Tax=Corchorus olitorius TaxID=93759 RepID=A0A1R3IYN0_9ROSI|nr:hypothetical protein COLO4_20614 [Corchorus olitorius]